MKVKWCPTCQQSLSVSEFHKDSRRRDGLHGQCKHCKKKARQKRVSRDPEAAKMRNRAGNIRRKYGITQEDYEEMLAKQDGKCAICGTLEEENHLSFCIDHNHSTGKVRELLCVHCNFGIGYFREDIDVLEAAIKYVTKHRGK